MWRLRKKRKNSGLFALFWFLLRSFCLLHLQHQSHLVSLHVFAANLFRQPFQAFRYYHAPAAPTDGATLHHADRAPPRGRTAAQEPQENSSDRSQHGPQGQHRSPLLRPLRGPAARRSRERQHHLNPHESDQQQRQCSVCLEPHSASSGVQVDHQPYTCQHQFCRKCFEVDDSCNDPNAKIFSLKKCPLCRALPNGISEVFESTVAASSSLFNFLQADEHRWVPAQQGCFNINEDDHDPNTSTDGPRGQGARDHLRRAAFLKHKASVLRYVLMHQTERLPQNPDDIFDGDNDPDFFQNRCRRKFCDCLYYELLLRAPAGPTSRSSTADDRDSNLGHLVDEQQQLHQEHDVADAEQEVGAPSAPCRASSMSSTATPVSLASTEAPADAQGLQQQEQLRRSSASFDVHPGAAAVAEQDQDVDGRKLHNFLRLFNHLLSVNENFPVEEPVVFFDLVSPELITKWIFEQRSSSSVDWATEIKPFRLRGVEANDISHGGGEFVYAFIHRSRGLALWTPSRALAIYTVFDESQDPTSVEDEGGTTRDGEVEGFVLLDDNLSRIFTQERLKKYWRETVQRGHNQDDGGRVVWRRNNNGSHLRGQYDQARRRFDDEMTRVQQNFAAALDDPEEDEHRNESDCRYVFRKCRECPLLVFHIATGVALGIFTGLCPVEGTLPDESHETAHYHFCERSHARCVVLGAWILASGLIAFKPCVQNYCFSEQLRNFVRSARTRLGLRNEDYGVPLVDIEEPPFLLREIEERYRRNQALALSMDHNTLDFDMLQAERALRNEQLSRQYEHRQEAARWNRGLEFQMRLQADALAGRGLAARSSFGRQLAATFRRQYGGADAVDHGGNALAPPPYPDAHGNGGPTIEMYPEPQTSRTNSGHSQSSSPTPVLLSPRGRNELYSGPFAEERARGWGYA
ncbi:unnamed protein product [Amoebophrya sp. A120]|nr:unnamed protein product [Amoebophrya sp. A120]|eukprot:GSA120T00012339001.1